MYDFLGTLVTILYLRSLAIRLNGAVFDLLAYNFQVFVNNKRTAR